MRQSLDSPTRKSWRTYYPFLILFYFNVFCSCAAYALVLPAIWLLLEDREKDDKIVAYVLVSFSVGEVIGAIIFGCLRDTFSTKTTLLITLCLGLIGSILGIVSGSDSEMKIAVLMISRVLQGVWNGGEQAVESAYISEVVSDVSKIRALSEIGIAGLFGLILGPIIGVVLSLIDINIYEDLEINSYSSPGIFQFIIITIMIIVNYIKFQEIPTGMRVNRMPDHENYATPNKFGIVSCLVLSFILFNGFTVQSTITGPLVTDSEHVFVI